VVQYKSDVVPLHMSTYFPEGSSPGERIISRRENEARGRTRVEC
jgi:hypothetical protein